MVPSGNAAGDRIVQSYSHDQRRRHALVAAARVLHEPCLRTIHTRHRTGRESPYRGDFGRYAALLSESSLATGRNFSIGDNRERALRICPTRYRRNRIIGGCNTRQRRSDREQRSAQAHVWDDSRF